MRFWLVFNLAMLALNFHMGYRYLVVVSAIAVGMEIGIILRRRG